MLKGIQAYSGAEAPAILLVPPRRAEELRQLVVDKWGCSYDVTLQRRGKNMYLHVM